MDDLKEISKEIRRKIITMCYHAGGGHVAPSFSCVEILVSLYFKIMDVNKGNYQDENRDRFILSKGHAAATLYAVLAEKGILDKNLLNTFCQKGTILGAHPDKSPTAGIEFSTGSLGHGLSIGAGTALAGKIDNKNYKTFVVLSDGECQEGSIWEAALFAAQNRLDNLIAIVDCNQMQALGKIENILGLKPFKEKWESFGWSVKEVDGHDISKIVAALEKIPFIEGKPNIVIAHTTKGKGCTFMENKAVWHYRIPSNKEEWETTCKELGLNREEFSEVLK